MSALLSWPNPKDPSDTLDYSVEMGGMLNPDGQSGDSIQTVVWKVPSALTKVSQAEAGTLAVIWLSGGLSGRSYVLNMHATSAQGRVIDRDIRLAVAER